MALEQHPDRTQLFMQWKQMGWPVLWDPFNILGFEVVPATYLVDPEGNVVLTQPTLDSLHQIEEVVLADRNAARVSDPRDSVVFGPGLVDDDPDRLNPAERSDRAAAMALWGGDLDGAAAEARRVVELDGDPVHLFRLGVVLRMRHDSEQRRPNDFASAVAAWSDALAADPNQYIWRRRLQQYGPRLAKPYPFYDWVPTARRDIEARGESPQPLIVEPGGAEFAAPSDGLPSSAAPATKEPDPEGRVTEDSEGMVQFEAVAIPPRAAPGHGVRLHIVLSPNSGIDAHWNNEAGPGEMWVDPPQGWTVDPRHQLLPHGVGDTSDELRHAEFEMLIPQDAPAGQVNVTGRLLYYVCEGRHGTCLYRRRNFSVPIQIRLEEEVTSLAG